MSITTTCAICARPLTINEIDPRFCPRCKQQPAKTRDVLEERIIVQEEDLATAYKNFYAVLEAADLETLTRYHTLLAARQACGVNDERWAVQRHREELTLQRGDALAKVLGAEQQLTTACAQITIAIDEANAQIWDLDQINTTYAWELPDYLLARRKALPALRVPGQPQLLAVRVVDPRPTVEPAAAPAAAPPARVKRCDECGAPIVWGRTVNNNPCPYDADAQGNKTDVSHFSTCTNPKRFSKAQPKGKKQAVAA